MVILKSAYSLIFELINPLERWYLRRKDDDDDVDGHSKTQCK